MAAVEKARGRGDDPPRVVITGLGVVSSLGLEGQTHFSRLFAGDSGVLPHEETRWRGIPLHFGAAVRDFNSRRMIRNRILRKLLQPNAAFAVAAAGQALRDAGLPEIARDDESRRFLERVGLYFGSVSYDLPSALYAPALEASFESGNQFSFDRFADQGMNLVDPLLIVKGLPNAALCGISIEFGVTGPNANFANGPVAGLQAVTAAVAAIRRHDVEIALAGASDSLMQPEHVIRHHLEGRLWCGSEPRKSACRPFATGRSGYVPGEGGAVFVLESAESATSRGATIYGEIVGSGETTVVAGDDEALAEAARQATSGRRPQAVFGQGLGTDADDRREAQALRRLFDRQPPLTSATAALGFTGAAGGVFALAHACQGLRDGRIPPTLGCDDPDPACPVHVSPRPIERQLDRVLVWASDGGVKNIALCLGAPSDVSENESTAGEEDLLGP